jgi:hypothetical protein
MARPADSWDGILYPGETVLWQGQPDPRLDWSGWRPSEAIFGTLIAIFAGFWMALAAGAHGGPFMGIAFPLLALPFLGIGIYRAGGRVLWDAHVRRHTWYTLTNQRAFIATDLFRRRDLAAYPMTPKTVLDREGSHIWFATDFHRTRNGSRRRRIGFTHLPEPDRVFALMARVQRAAT